MPVQTQRRRIYVTAPPCIEGLALQQAVTWLAIDPFLRRAFEGVRWVEASELEANWELFEHPDAALIIVMGDVATALEAMARKTPLPPYDLLRQATSEHTLIRRCRGLANAEWFRIHRDRMPDIDFSLALHAIAPTLDRKGLDRAVALVMDQLNIATRRRDAKGAPKLPALPPASQGGRSEMDWRMVAFQTLNVFEADRNHTSATSWWPREVFWNGSDMGKTCPEAIDLTGLARIIVYGPYLWLYAGQWTASFAFDADNQCGAVVMRFDIFDGQSVLAERRVQLSGAGSYEAELQFELTQDRALETRVWLEAAAIDGFVAFKGVSMMAARRF